MFQKSNPPSQQLDTYISLGWWVWKRYFFKVWELLTERCLLDDLRQEIRLIALEGNSLQLPNKSFLKYANRRLYRFLVNYGFKKPQGENKFLPEEEYLYNYILKIPKPTFFDKVENIKEDKILKTIIQ